MDNLTDEEKKKIIKKVVICILALIAVMIFGILIKVLT